MQKCLYKETDLAPVATWAEISEVAWKLTDGVMTNEPKSGLLGSINSSRALAWVVDSGWRAKTAKWGKAGHIKGSSRRL
jgi:hypothetical protein